MRQAKLLTILFAGLLGLISQPVWAVLIDQGDSVLDTDNRMEWLKLTATDGKSANAAIGEFGPDGWTLAGESQYESLFDAFFPTYTDPDGNGYELVKPGSVLFDQGGYFAELFGSTDTGPSINASYGFYEGNDGLLHYGGVYQNSGGRRLFRDMTSDFDKYRTVGHSNAGIFMVRPVLVPVPAPASLLLLGLGLACLTLARRFRFPRSTVTSIR